jgi:hypothetical protein
MDALPHPANEELFRYLVTTWKSYGYPPPKPVDMTVAPWWIKLFDSLADELDEPEKITKDMIYGTRIAATPYHLVFAWMGGDAIFVKIRTERHKEALAAGGRLDPTYPPNWVEFMVGGMRMPAALRSQWRDVIRYWMQVSYTDSLEGTAAQKADIGAFTIKPPEEAQQPDPRENALCITLTLTTTYSDLDSLKPFCAALTSPRRVEAAKEYTDRTGKGLITLSDKTNLFISFPQRPNNRRFIFQGCLGGLLLGVTFFDPDSVGSILPLLFAPVGGMLAFSATSAINLSRSADVMVRGTLKEIMAASNDLSSWLSTAHGRKVRLEVLDETHIETEAHKPEEVAQMFQPAVRLQEQRMSIVNPA